MTNKSKKLCRTRKRRFEKVASNRVQKIIDFLGLLGNCANKNNYDYTEKMLSKCSVKSIVL